MIPDLELAISIDDLYTYECEGGHFHIVFGHQDEDEGPDENGMMLMHPVMSYEMSLS